MFDDLAKYEQDETIEHHVFTPAGEPVVFPVEGKDVQLVLVLASRDCDEAKRAAHKFQNKTFRQVTKAATGGSKKNLDRAADGEAHDLSMAVICTRGWNLHNGGKPVPFTADAVRNLYTYKGFPFILASVVGAIGDRALFDPTNDEDGELEEDEDTVKNS